MSDKDTGRTRGTEEGAGIGTDADAGAGESKTSSGGIGYVLHLAGKSRNLLIVSAVFSVASGLCTFIPFVMVFQTFLDLFEGTGSVSDALRYGVIAAIAILLKFLFLIVALGLSHIGAFNTLYSVRAAISDHISHINLGFFTSNTMGEIKKVIIEDVERIEKFLAHQIPDLVAAIVVPVAVFIYMLTINVPMALCILAPVVIGLILQVVAMRLAGGQMAEYHQLLGKLNSAIMQFVNGMPVMKSYNLTAASYREYSDTITQYNAFWKRCTRDQGYTYGVFVALVESGILFALPLGGLLYLQESLPLSSYLFFMIMSIVFLSSLLNLMNFALTFNQISSGTDRIKQIMDIPEPKTKGLQIQPNSVEELTFDSVSFSYGKTEVLKEVDIRMSNGELTAFVGASGAGKSTAAQLIPKFWETTGGNISINGVNINDLQSENLMELVSFVFQETFMMNDTIYQNIAIGKEGVTREEVEQAARAAQIHDFIVSLPDGYETKLGEHGVKLSGGEKQRLCIARAILKDAPIIVFDEATSYTDIENEYKIQQGLSSLLKGKTTIMIAHRLHTITGADRICVFDRGRIVETGTHRELLEKEGLYTHMWNVYVSERGGVSL